MKRKKKEFEPELEFDSEFMSGYVTIDNKIAKKIGLISASVLAELKRKELLAERRDEINEDGYFIVPTKEMEAEFGLSKYKQKTILRKLKDFNLIDIKYMDVPAKRYIKIIRSESEWGDEKWCTEKKIMPQSKKQYYKITT